MRKSLGLVSFYGYTMDMVSYSREAMGLGSIRCQTSGTTDIIMCSTQSLAEDLFRHQFQQMVGTGMEPELVKDEDVPAVAAKEISFTQVED